MNPFIERKKGLLHSVPFDIIKVEHFIPAIKKGIEEGKTNLEKIKETKEANFDNTIFALEHVSDLLDQASGIYFNLFSAESTPEHSKLAGEVSALCSNFSSDIFLDGVLFTKVKEVYDNREKYSLTAEQKKLLENTYKAFVRNGALLNKDEKDILRKIDEELSQLSPKFSENLLKETNSYELKITEKSDLAGLPKSAIDQAEEAAKAKKYQGTWLFTLDGPSITAFLKYSEKRDLRRQIWFAYNSRCTQGENSNKEIIQEIIDFKIKRSKLLGFQTYADYVLEERMAQSPAKVWKFLDDLILASSKAAQNDLKEVQNYAKQKDNLDKIEPWDFSYYSELLRKQKYNFDEEELRPYFKLENVIEGVFKVASELFEITFKPNTHISVYHPDVKVFEVHNRKNNEYIGLFYCDFFPRPTKKGGAWMTDFNKQGLNVHHEMEVPHVSIVCNFTKPTGAEPSLLTFDEVSTLFHEFGHSLHGLLSKVSYKSLAGTNVFWDFVELPSQFMENFLLEKEVLDLFAIHYKTNQKIPQELIDKLKRSSKFQSGFFSLRQLNFAMLDMKWFTLLEPLKTTVEEFELKATEKTRLFNPIEGTNSSCGFAHIFGGGYSAGYYSYKWAEVLDADAFEYFKEKGLFNPDVSHAFRENILSKGGTEHPMELYKKFRGREPDPKALLRRDGLI